MRKDLLEKLIRKAKIGRMATGVTKGTDITLSLDYKDWAMFWKYEVRLVVRTHAHGLSYNSKDFRKEQDASAYFNFLKKKYNLIEGKAVI